MNMQGLPSPGIVDVAAAALVALAALRGVFRGLSRELAGLVSLVAAAALGILFYRPAGVWLRDHSHLAERPACAAAFAAIVVGAWIAMMLLHWLLRRVFRVVAEERAERIGGGLAGAASGICLVVVVLVAANLTPNPKLNRRFGDESICGHLLRRTVPYLRELVAGAGDIEIPDGTRKR